jgi:hypothetical protein
MPYTATQQSALRVPGGTPPGIEHIEPKSPDDGCRQRPGHQTLRGKKPQSDQEKHNIAPVIEDASQYAGLSEPPCQPAVRNVATDNDHEQAQCSPTSPGCRRNQGLGAAEDKRWRAQKTQERDEIR